MPYDSCDICSPTDNSAGERIMSFDNVLDVSSYWNFYVITHVNQSCIHINVDSNFRL